MTTRLLALPAILVALFAVSYSPARSELPQAPTPRAKRSHAELLVGTWRLVKLGNQAPIERVEYEFTKGGKFTSRVTDPTGPPQRSAGTYEIQGKTIRFHAVAIAEEPAETWDFVIELLTETELVTASQPADARLQSVFKRVEKK